MANSRDIIQAHGPHHVLNMLSLAQISNQVALLNAVIGVKPSMSIPPSRAEIMMSKLLLVPSRKRKKCSKTVMHQKSIKMLTPLKLDFKVFLA